MAKPGRKSASELSAVTELPKHLEAPADLDERHASIWRDAVSAMKVGFFKPEHRPSLEAYCRHAIREKDLSAELANYMPTEKEYKIIRDMADKESAKMLAHARSLRLTPQSQYDEKKASRSNNPAPGKKLWQV